jgi:serine/threonine-protein kinase
VSPKLFEQLEGKYEILEKISEGGMGAVYKVRHRLLDEIHVVKLIRPQLEHDHVIRSRFLREARTTVRLRHPNIAQFFDLTMDDEGNAFVVMEFVDGVTIETLVEKTGPLPPALAVHLAIQALEALSYLHRRSIIHRDVSPDNLMVTVGEEGGPHVKLIDLGIAKILGGQSKLTATGTFLGKVRYASPEQFRAQSTDSIDARSDLYSMGIVTYEMLTGRLPVRGSDLSSLIAGHLIHAPIPFAESDREGRVPDDLRTIVMRSLEKRPEDRFASAAEFIAGLSAVAARCPLDGGASSALIRRLVSGVGEGQSAAEPATTKVAVDRDSVAPMPSPTGAASRGATPRFSAAVAAEEDAATQATGSAGPVELAPTAGLPIRDDHESVPGAEQSRFAAAAEPLPPASPDESDARAAPARPDALESLLSDARLLLEAGRAREALLKVERAASLDALNDEARSLERLAQAALRGVGGSVSPANEPAGVTEVDLGSTVENVAVERARVPSRAPSSPDERQLDREPAPDANAWPVAVRPAPQPATPPARAERTPASARAAVELPSVTPSRRPRLGWRTAAIGAVVALSAGIIVVVQSRTWRESPPQGTLVINAVPWGRVQEVVDSRGRQVAARTDAFTPVSLTLPPGRYSVSVVNPDSAREVRFEADVVAGEVVRKRVELGRLSEDELLRGLGLGR